MKSSVIVSFLAAASLSVAMPSSHQTRSVRDVLPGMKRDASGAGFTHVGSDNVARSFDKDFNVVDFRQLDDRAPSEGGWPRSPSAAVLAEAKKAHARSGAETSKPRPRGPLEETQEKSCVSHFCHDDKMCRNLSIYGYSCGTCMIVSESLGNCQQL
ncbi:hypothetical protein F4818DRAFT_452304 [Hypoxylon cercidicola]|nr:hypothetical protein F4818DRAFT_452304 [Hypoxylon cercidicola]